MIELKNKDESISKYMRKLISMRAFVLEQEKLIEYEGSLPGFTISVTNYANFLSQILEIWMFAPAKLVDGIWVVLEEPKMKAIETIEGIGAYYINIKDSEEYQEALSNVLFEGYSVRKDFGKAVHLISQTNLSIIYDLETGFNFMGHPKVSIIEDLIPYNLTLTRTSTKKLGL